MSEHKREHNEDDLNEIADGVWGDGPAVRGRARDEIARLNSIASERMQLFRQAACLVESTKAELHAEKLLTARLCEALKISRSQLVTLGGEVHLTEKYGDRLQAFVLREIDSALASLKESAS